MPNIVYRRHFLAPIEWKHIVGRSLLPGFVQSRLLLHVQHFGSQLHEIQIAPATDDLEQRWIASTKDPSCGVIRCVVWVKSDGECPSIEDVFEHSMNFNSMVKFFDKDFFYT